MPASLCATRAKLAHVHSTHRRLAPCMRSAAKNQLSSSKPPPLSHALCTTSCARCSLSCSRSVCALAVLTATVFDALPAEACNILAGGRGARPSSARRGRHANKDRASVRVGRVDSPRRAPPGGGSRAPPPTRTRRPPSHARWRQPASGPRVGPADIALPSGRSSATRWRPPAAARRRPRRSAAV